MIREARISADGIYRYTLSRTWREDASHMVFVMLNPSTADHTVDDPTIRRCMHFANREGCGGIIVINLYAGRATEPHNLFRMANTEGPENKQAWFTVLSWATAHGWPVITAWGAQRKARNKAKEFIAFAFDMAVPLHCLNSLTQEGFPRHPLYLPNDSLLRRFA